MLPNYTQNQNKQASKGELGREIASALEGITLEKVAEAGLLNASQNAAFIANGQSIVALRDTMLGKGKDALVIGAGPSLHRFDTAKIIKEFGFEGIIVATESAMSWCLRHDIVPHLVVTLDPHASRIVRWFGDPNLTEEDLVKDDYYTRQDMDPAFWDDQLLFNRKLVDLLNRYGSEMRIAVASSASPAVVKRVMESGMLAYWWNPMYDDYDTEGSLTRRINSLNGLPCVNAGGNVGTACWVFSHALLGKRRVGLVGIDCGYYIETPYSRTQYYKEILDLVGPDRLDEVYVHMRNPHLNKDFYTDPAYLWYRDIFVEMVQQSECETYNCTGGGILFGPGIHWATLPEFFETCKT